MKRSTVAIATVAALCAMFFATDASAKKKSKSASLGGALEIRAGGNFSLVYFTEESAQYDPDYGYTRQILKSDDPLIGGGLEVSIGYRFAGLFGIYVEQQFAWLRLTGGMERRNPQYDEASKLGSTYLTFKFILPFGDSDLDFGVGLGAMYSINNNREHQYTMIINKNVYDALIAVLIRLFMRISMFYDELEGHMLDLRPKKYAARTNQSLMDIFNRTIPMTDGINGL